MKYLLIATVAALVFVFVYSRLRPYLQLIQKIVSALNVSASVGTSSPSQTINKNENKLVRCDGCGTWIPESRALTLKSGLTTYCSAECLEKNSGGKERKLAG